MFKLNKLTPGVAIERLAANDPTLKNCDLSKNAVLQMKGPELIPQLAVALASNTHCMELNLADCNITDQTVAPLGEALAKNKGLVNLTLSDNKIGNDGGASLASGIASNQTLMQLDLFGQKGTKFGDATLHAFTTMFDKNITLLKIVWRLESRQSFRLTKMLTRNNEIDRRIKDRRDYGDLLPDGVTPLSAALVEQRNATGFSVGTPRTSTADGSGRNSDASDGGRAALRPVQLGGAGGSASARSSVSLSRESSSESPADGELQKKLAALDDEYERQLAALKSAYASKKSALLSGKSDGAIPWIS